MKKIISMALALLLTVAFCTSALAAPVNLNAIMAIQMSDETVYVGGDNFIYETGGLGELSEIPTRSLVYADSSHILFTVVDEQNEATFEEAGILMSLALNAADAEAETVDTIIGDSVYVLRDGVAYFVSQDQPGTLKAFNPMTGAVSEVASLDGQVVSLTASIDGLIVKTEASEKLYVAATSQFADANVPSEGTTIRVHDGFETLLSADGELSIRNVGQKADEVIKIDAAVSCATMLDGMVYYLKTDNGTAVLMSYDYTAKSVVTIGKFKSQMLPEIAAAGGQVFMLSADYAIYAMSAVSHTVSEFQHLNIQDGIPVLVATNDILLVYEASNNDGAMVYLAAYPLKDDVPVIDVTAPEEVVPAPETEETDDEEPEEEAEPEVEKPTVLTKGSRGDDVRELQNILKKHGYPAGSADGIYGSNTAVAVKYLQGDLGVKETGTVTLDFLNELRNKKLPTYEKYVPLKHGDRGIRVYNMQRRLRGLGWMTTTPDGVYGENTVKAVKHFEKEIGEKESGNASVNFLKHLFAKDAPGVVVDEPKPTHHKDKPKPTKKPSSHKKPKQEVQVDEDDLINMVRWINDRFPGGNYGKEKAIYKLQKRLVELGYMKKKQCTKVYDETTFIAVKSFQVDGDFLPHPSGIPTKSTLEQLFGTGD